MNHQNSISHSSRREFLKQSSKFGLLCGFACLCPHTSLKLHGEGETGAMKPDPKKLNYCGYTCPDDCPMKKAGLSNDIEQKRAAYEKWRIKERYGLEFEPSKVLCNGCKTDKDELGMAVSNCPVRKCAVEKKLECCIECDTLASCDKVLWKEFPSFHEYVIGLQKSYLGSMG